MMTTSRPFYGAEDCGLSSPHSSPSDHSHSCPLVPLDHGCAEACHVTPCLVVARARDIAAGPQTPEEVSVVVVGH